MLVFWLNQEDLQHLVTIHTYIIHIPDLVMDLVFIMEGSVDYFIFIKFFKNDKLENQNLNYLIKYN